MTKKFNHLFEIPVTWIMAGEILVEANTKGEAIEKAYDMDFPKGEYLEDSFDIDKENIEQLE
jgi:hypothetical protein